MGATILERAPPHSELVGLSLAVQLIKSTLLLIALVFLDSLVASYRSRDAVIVLPGKRVTEVERLQAIAKVLKDRDYVRRVEVRSGGGWGFLDFDDSRKSWMTFDRPRQYLEDQVMGGNCNGEWEGVTEQALFSVARAKGNLLDALSRFGARNVCP